MSLLQFYLPCGYAGARLKLDVPVVGLFLRVARLFGIQLSASCLEEIKVLLESLAA